MPNWFVYILKCSDGGTYTGCTQNMEERQERHTKGYIESTKDRLPVEIVTYTVFSDKYKAYEFEKYLKSGSGRTFAKRHLI
jgi:predicted GIY-YIG superfamily endonuclease